MNVALSSNINLWSGDLADIMIKGEIHKWCLTCAALCWFCLFDHLWNFQVWGSGSWLGLERDCWPLKTVFKVEWQYILDFSFHSPFWRASLWCYVRSSECNGCCCCCSSSSLGLSSVSRLNNIRKNGVRKLAYLHNKMFQRAVDIRKENVYINFYFLNPNFHPTVIKSWQNSRLYSQLGADV